MATMTAAPSTNNILLGRGQLFFDRFDVNGNRTGYFFLGNCSTFEIQLKDDVLSLYTSQHPDAGVLKRATRHRDSEVVIKGNEYSVLNMWNALMGDTATYSQSSSAISGEILTTSVTAGRVYKTAFRGMSAEVITQGTATWTSGTDYTVVDATMGLIQVLSPTGAHVTTATTATIAYTRGAITTDAIYGSTKTKVEGGLLFVPDPTTGPQWDVEVWRAALIPQGSVPLISDNWGEFEMMMTILNDASGTYGGSATSPYYRWIPRGVA